MGNFGVGMEDITSSIMGTSIAKRATLEALEVRQPLPDCHPRTAP